MEKAKEYLDTQEKHEFGNNFKSDVNTALEIAYIEGILYGTEYSSGGTTFEVNGQTLDLFHNTNTGRVSIEQRLKELLDE